METRLKVLKLVLDELGVSSDIKTKRERIAVQKAIYLAQAAGADLGYVYNYYINGPYSPRLTRDYFDLEEELQVQPKISERLNDSYRETLKTLARVLRVPSHVGLKPYQWKELLASLHFLVDNRGMKPRAAKERLRETKRELAKYVAEAEEALEEASLL